MDEERTMIYKIKRYSISQIGVPEVWDKIRKEIKLLEKKNKVYQEDWFDYLYIEPDENPHEKKYVSDLPNDIIKIGGLGYQGSLDIYYSPSKGYYTGGGYSGGSKPTPQKVSLPQLKRQILSCLDNDIKHLKDDAGEGFTNFIKYQKETRDLIQKYL